MRALKQSLLVAAVALTAASAGVVLSQGRTSGSQPATDVAPLMRLSLTDVQRGRQSMDQYRGKVLVVNFWATWCAPCREEMPEFSAVSRKYAGKGVQFVGIGIDSVENVQKFVKEVQVAYPLLVGESDAMQASAALGNRMMGLPFTAVLTRKGGVSLIKLGKLSEVELESALQKALADG